MFHEKFPFYPVPSFALVRGQAISFITTSKELAARAALKNKKQQIINKKIIIFITLTNINKSFERCLLQFMPKSPSLAPTPQRRQAPIPNLVWELIINESSLRLVWGLGSFWLFFPLNNLRSWLIEFLTYSCFALATAE